jgi:O-6-methylguanine DNA methyltransferase
MTTFKEKVLDIVRAIPKGEVLTYGEVAKRAGTPGAARAVGTIMAANDDLTVPCHRVIRSDGKIGEYNGLRGPSKEELLRKEGVCLK